MATNIRNKGQRGEREAAKLFLDDLGIDAERNLQQTRAGGYDLSGVPFFAVEVKRHESPNVTTFWRQALRQGEDTGLMPVVMYRRNRQPWIIVMRAVDVYAIPAFTNITLPVAKSRIFNGLVELTWTQFKQVFRFYVSPGTEV